ncbi:MAG: glycoside hydrolase family 130 protein [Balneolaceae bacterium]|nr:glycoside hydrolase family 130 protein [Balneolaceae bacterium]
MATFNPAAIVYDDKINVLYRAEDKTGEMVIGGHTSRIGLAVSEDGMNYVRQSEPILYPKEDNQKKYEWPGGCEDPRIVETKDGDFILTYTQWDHDTPRLAVATSKDLKEWTKHGPVFENAYNGKYLNMESKSGAILSRLKDGKMIATKVNGKYWMYFGVPQIWIATSTDLINWTPVEDQNGVLMSVLSPREGYFDSWLVEAGPPPVLTEDGIMVFYNAGNNQETGNPNLGDRVIFWWAGIV